MKLDGWLATLKHHRAIAILRAPSLAAGLSMAQAAVAGGFRLIEVTWTSDRPAALVTELRQRLPADCCVGVGTVLEPQALQTAIAAGAQFCFSPHIDREVLALGCSRGLPMMPGALTPTEIVAAWQAGASGVKVFPCQAVGGAAYIRHLQGPLGHIPLIPTGGVTLEAGSAYLAAGAIAIGVSSSLFPPAWVQAGQWSAIEARSRTFLAALKGYRQPSSAGR